MSYNLSGCVFIKDCFKGAFCLFESMYQLLPLCDEFIVLDLGSTDGTMEVLKEIEAHNLKVSVIEGQFHKQDASVFADLANDLVGMCTYPNVLYYQADEIWHEDLIKLTRQALDQGKRDLSFWRVQLKYNFQRIKWFPHPVHRIGPKDNFNFVGDGMNTERTFDAEMISEYGYIVRKKGIELKRFKNYEYELAKKYANMAEAVINKEKLWDMGHFPQWESNYRNIAAELPVNEMILDVSGTGAFIDNIPDKRRMHLPFWNEGDVMPADEGGLSIDDWYKYQQDNDEWLKTETAFNIPEIMKYHLGKRKYELRPQLLEMLKQETGWR